MGPKKIMEDKEKKWGVRNIIGGKEKNGESDI